MEYHKIDTIFERNEDFTVNVNKLKNTSIGIIKEWQVTEKIDGTNIRVTLTKEGNIIFGGRTDNAQIPASLLQVLINMFDKDKLKEIFWKDGSPCEVVLYGEGYGAGIQKVGGLYRPDKSFRLFDILVKSDNCNWWLNWENTCNIAEKIGIKTVPFLGVMTLDQIVEMVKQPFFSETARQDSGQNVPAEGVIGRTIETLYDKRMKRLIIKLKTCDFVKGKK